MDDHLWHELRALRARAYGPGADLHEDPTALNRLRELEQLARGPESAWTPSQSEPAVVSEVEPAVVPAAAPEAMPEAEPESIRDAAPTAPAPTAPEPTAPDPTAPAPTGSRRITWTKRRIAIAWIASVVAAIVVATTVTGVVSRRIQADPREVAVLGVDPFAEWPTMFLSYSDDGEPLPADRPRGGQAFEAFHGLSVFAMPNGGSDGAEELCLSVVDAANIVPEPGSFEGAFFAGCAVGEFAATVELLVADGPQNLPDELIDAFPEGTALQFVLDGDEVVVLSDAP